MQFSQLSKATQRLLTLCRKINFGYITEIGVTNGELHATDSTRKCTFMKLDRAAAANAETPAPYDFTLCAAQEQFIRTLRQIGDGRIKSIEIRDGRPVSVSLEEAVAAI